MVVSLFSTAMYADTENPKQLSVAVNLNPQPTQAPKNTTLSPQQIQDLYTLIVKHLEFIESEIDAIGQRLVSGASRLDKTQKANVQQALYGIRSQLEAIKQATAQHVDLQSLCLLASFTRIVIDYLQQAVNNKLLIMPVFSDKKLHDSVHRLNDNTLQKLSTLLQENELALARLSKDVEIIGLTKTNQAYRKFRGFAKKYALYDVAEHVLVYTAFVAWVSLITSKKTINQLTGDEEVYARDDDGNIMYLKDTDGQFITPEGQVVSTIDERVPLIIQPSTLEKWTGTLLGSFKHVVGSLPFTETTKHTSYINGNNEGIVTFVNATGQRSSSVVNTSGSAKATLMQSIVKFASDQPVAIVTAGPLFAAYFLRDAKAIYKQWEKARTHIDNYLFGTAKQPDFAESTIPKERFENIVGREEIKSELSIMIEYIAHPDRYNRADIKIPRGYLFAGSPQTGKTFMARALSGEISDALERAGKSEKVRFFEISTDNLKKNGIYYYIDLAKQFAPCILFFDELDLARLQRDGDSGLLSEFLQCMSEGLSNDEKDQVFILGVTNKPSNLDFALLQPGRFSKVIYFEKPTFQHRVDYFKTECHKRCMNMSNFNFEELAQLTEGCHFGALKQVMRTACMSAKIEGAAVTQVHFLRAINTEVHQIISGAPAIPAKKEQMIAIHQAGKALANILLAPEQQLCQVTVLPVTQEVEEEHVTQQYKWNNHDAQKDDNRLIHYGDTFAFHNHDALDMISQKELIKNCKITLAGNVAQLIVGLDQCIDVTDKKKAFYLAKKIVLQGLDSRDLSKNTAEEKLSEAMALLLSCEKEVQELLTPHKNTIFKIADALQKQKTLTAAQIKALI